MAALAGLAGVVASVGLLAVIAAGFALSFDAIGAVGRASGIRAELAWLLPMAVDGAMAVGTVTVVVVRRLGRPTVYPWAVVLVNALISVTCNGLHAYAGPSVDLPGEIAVVVSAVPAVNLALSVHLLAALVDALAEVLIGSARRAIGGSAESGGEPPVSVLVPEETERSAAAAARARYGRVSAARATKSAIVSTVVPRVGGAGWELQRAAWRWTRENRRRDGSLPSGAEIAQAHGRSPRWGRLVKRNGLQGGLG